MADKECGNHDKKEDEGHGKDGKEVRVQADEGQNR